MYGYKVPKSYWFAATACLISFVATVGCVPKPENALIVYSAADREFAEPIIAAYQRRNPKTEVVPQFDVESTKTVGLVTRIESESARPRCDVFWNNEIMHILRLESAGLLAPISWDIPSDWPASMRSKQKMWVGFGARARVLLVNRELLPASGERPKSVLELADPRWQNKCGVASPLFGTTATHFTVLAEKLGSERATEFFSQVKQNAVVLAGNKQVAQAVSAGQLAFGLTDTDDALIEIDNGLPVEIIFPDQAAEQMGTLMIPNTVAVLKNAPHPIAARSMANFLLSEDTEGRLAMGSSGQFPIRPNHPQKSRANPSTPIRPMEVDFEKAAALWPTVSKQLSELFVK
ncbi:MAG: extracellular solute-binding protein [Pirellulaceae bacterium]|nr:extracellular solute-binding protein [Pirellulaceae bacterium]